MSGLRGVVPDLRGVHPRGRRDKAQVVTEADKHVRDVLGRAEEKGELVGNCETFDVWACEYLSSHHRSFG